VPLLPAQATPLTSLLSPSALRAVAMQGTVVELGLIIMVLALRLPRLMYCAASAALVKVRPNLILQGGSKNNLFDIASLVLKNLHRSCGAGFFMAR